MKFQGTGRRIATRVHFPARSAQGAVCALWCSTEKLFSSVAFRTRLLRHGRAGRRPRDGRGVPVSPRGLGHGTTQRDNPLTCCGDWAAQVGDREGWKTMTRQARTFFFAISILAAPMTGAVAQPPPLATTSLQGATGAPAPGNKTPTSAAAAASKMTPPGATGTRVHPGSSNTAAGDQPGTAEPKAVGGTGESSGSGSGR